MNKVKILFSGITGRTGKAAKEIENDCDDVKIVAGISRNNTNFYNYDNLDIITEDFDIIVDFSHKDSFDKILAYALKVKKPLIIGTAKLTSEQINSLIEASYKIPIFKGGNFRFEVKDFIDNVTQYIKKSDKKEFELIENHYKTKTVPSETAKVIVKRVFEETGKKVNIKSLLEYDELINDYRLDDLHCRVKLFKGLAKDVFKISVMMANKIPNGIYDLDKLINETIKE